MRSRRIDVGPVVALVGATLLLVSPFLEWFDPGVTAWEVFEVIDLLLAAAAVAAILAALRPAGVPGPALDLRWLGWAAGAALLLTVAALLDPPPAARGAERAAGSWLALGGAAVMAVGALLSLARVRLSVDVDARRRATTGVDAAADEEPTRPFGPTPPPESRL